MAGDPDAPLNGAQAVRNVDLVHNTIVNNLDETFGFGANSNDTRTIGPQEVNVASNIVHAMGSTIVREDRPSTVAYSGNIFFGASTGVLPGGGTSQRTHC